MVLWFLRGFEFLVRACGRYTCVLGTSSPEGVPNVVPIGYVKLFDGRLLADFYFTKTKENIIKNPKVVITYCKTGVR
jgi:predicted pyridoxine 5'-phosphate oxidase superfamily flavin-nucleotide-binding protein